MAYSLAGRSTEFCSCSSPCPCAFAQEPDNGRCQGMIYLNIEEGDLDETSLAGTRAILVSSFGPAPWTSGGFSAAVVIESGATEEQRTALQRILSGEAGGEAAGLAQLISDFKGFVEADFEGEWTDERISVKAGDYVEASGSLLKNLDGSANIEVTNAAYPLNPVTAGKADKVRINFDWNQYDGPGTGMWTGPFHMTG